MIEFGITVVLVALLIAVIVFLKKRKNLCSCCPTKETPQSEPKVPEQVKQQPEIKSTDKSEVKAELVSNPPVSEAKTVTPPEPKPANIESSVKPQAVSPTENLLPEDSILKRHYLAHVSSMIESSVPPRPMDSVLCRHYDAMIVAEIDRCLTDNKAMEQLIHNYENKK